MRIHKQLTTITISLLLLAVSACSKKADVPDDARLIWQGVPKSSNEWKNLIKEDEGTLYLVEAKSGKVKEVRTIWKENRNFTFTTERDTEYQLYFRSDLPEK